MRDENFYQRKGDSVEKFCKLERLLNKGSIKK